MPIVDDKPVATSLKLPRAVKLEIDAQARQQGLSAHAYMVQALAQKAEYDKEYAAFVQSALIAEMDMERAGQAYDAAELLAYYKAKVSGLALSKPSPRPLSGRRTA